MFSSFQPTTALAAAADLLPTHATWLSEPEDVAFGCECADPALQIASWGQEAAQGSQARPASGLNAHGGSRRS